MGVVLAWLDVVGRGSVDLGDHADQFGADVVQPSAVVRRVPGRQGAVTDQAVIQGASLVLRVVVRAVGVRVL